MLSGFARSLKVTHGARRTPVPFAPISECERLPPIFTWAISLECVTRDGRLALSSIFVPCVRIAMKQLRVIVQPSVDAWQ